MEDLIIQEDQNQIELPEKNIEQEQFQEELVGYGVSSEVYLVKGEKKFPYILKKFKKEYPKEDIQLEGELHKKIISENIINLFEINERQLVLEYAKNGDMLEFIRRKGQQKISEKLARTLFRQLIQGLTDMHKQNIAHRDIKLDNLLLTEDFTLKIADFGWATQYKSNQLFSQRAGTEESLPPEVLEYRPYSPEKVDVFQCGIVLFTMVIGMSPISFRAKKNDKVYKFFANKNSPQFWKALRDKKNMHVSEDFKELLDELLHFDFKQRPSFESILQKDWVKKGPVYSDQKEFKMEMEKIINQGEKLKQQQFVVNNTTTNNNNSQQQPDEELKQM